jgi:hypothetical protein
MVWGPCSHGKLTLMGWSLITVHMYRNIAISIYIAHVAKLTLGWSLITVHIYRNIAISIYIAHVARVPCSHGKLTLMGWSLITVHMYRNIAISIYIAHVAISAQEKYGGFLISKVN